MTIDEVIEQEKFKARVDRIKANKIIFHNNDEYKISACYRSAEEHEQIAEWLEELRIYQQHEVICHKGYNAGYNKAIDDFVNACEKQLTTMFGQRYADMRDIKNIAEQLKEGAGNDKSI